MKLKEILPRSIFGTIATVIDESSITKLKTFLAYNEDALNRFNKIVLVINWNDDVDQDIVDRYQEEWMHVHPAVQIDWVFENRGHMIGTIDLEDALLKHIKKHYPECKYLWKSMDDVLISENIFDVEVPVADFYYLPSISYEKVEMKSKYIPQTTFFILNISEIDNLYGDDVEQKWMIYKKQLAKNPNIKPWEIDFDVKFDCENHLDRTVGNLKRYCLIEKDLVPLCKLILEYKIWDPSHKNIFFDSIGICHYHFYNQSVLNV